MDLIKQFESKVKYLWWEKVYFARDIMKIFWYDKWERFYWAINRTTSSLDKKVVDENFFFSVNKSTWWRPKEDVFLTLWACYLVLKNCDDRKDEVKVLKRYLIDLFEENKQNLNNKKYINYDKIYVFLFLWFLLLLIWFYVKNYTSLLYLTWDKRWVITSNISQLEILKTKLKVEEKLKEFDKKISLIPKENLIIKWVEDDFNKNLNDYIIETINNKDISYKNFKDNFNIRTNFLKNITWEDLIKAYFKLWNNLLFKDSCSLLSPNLCLSSTKWSLKNFWNFFTKTKSGYEINYIKKVKEDKLENIYCVEYKYKLKNDLSNDYIIETFNYTTSKNWDYEQVIKRFCEKITKWQRSLKCPYELNNYYCD